MTAQLARQVPFNVLAPGVRAIRAELDAGIQRVGRSVGTRDFQQSLQR